MDLKLIFLDFDGVIITADIADIIGFHKLSEALVDRLNQIVDATNAMVVVTSDWRIGKTRTQLCDILVDAGFRGTVLNKLPCDLDHNNFGTSRSTRIKEFIDDCNHNIINFVIIDDLDIEWFTTNVVLTNSRIGLTDSDVDKAVNILNGK